MSVEVVDSTRTADWLSLMAALGPTVTTLLVGLLGFGGVIWSVRTSARLSREQRQHELDQEKAGLAAALMGEIASILMIVEMRGYIDGLRAAVERGHSDIADFEVYTFKARQSYFEVFSGNLSKIGLLPGGLAETVVRFYTACRSILEDADQLYEGIDGDASSKLRRMNSMLALMVTARHLGVQVVIALAELSDQPVPHVVGLIEAKLGERNAASPTERE